MATQPYQQGAAIEPAGDAHAAPYGGDRPSRRLHGLDALRGGALLLGIVLHALLPFQVDTQWAVADAQSSPLVKPLTAVIHLFRMTLFMTLAGYFGAMVLRKRGARSYLRDRATRILLPAIAFYPVAVVSIGVLTAWNDELRNLPPTPVPDGMGWRFLAMPGVLWFLWVLMECALLVVAARALLLRALGDQRAATTLTPAVMDALPLPAGAAVTALAGWSWVYGLLGVSVRFLGRERPLLRYLADASYWAYLLHLPPLLLIEIPIADQPWPIPVKLALTLGVTGLVLLVSYHVLVRSTALGRWLNGRSHPLHWPRSPTRAGRRAEVQHDRTGR